MTITPLLAPPEAQPTAQPSNPLPATEALSTPVRLGLAGLGAVVGLFARLAAANGVGDLNSRPLMLAAAATSALIGLSLVLIAADRDRFGPSLGWITAVTAASWGVLNWISPPFHESVTVWSKPDQALLALVGVGNGVLLAGLVVLAFVRRGPTLTVAATMCAGVAALAANSVLLRQEWPAIVLTGLSFACILLAWDRSPRSEQTFVPPEDPPRVSRASLSFLSVALCGTALQLWVSRDDIPRAALAIALCVVLIVAAFASLVRVRREIERRETTLSEWTSWMREIRRSDFRAEMASFDSSAPSTDLNAGIDGEAPRKLSFPNLSIPDTPSPDIVPSTPLLGEDLSPRWAQPDAGIDNIGAGDLAAAAAELTADVTGGISVHEALAADAPAHAPANGAFSAMLTADTSLAATAPSPVEITSLEALGRWLVAPGAASRDKPLLVAVEALTLDEFESLPAEDAAMARDEIGRFLGDAMPTADLVAWIDGPYFIVAHASKPDAALLELNKAVLKELRPTNGVLALLRPGPEPELDDIVNQAVMGLLQARRMAPSTAR